MEDLRPTYVGWATARKAADHLGVSTRTIFRWASSNILPSYRIGRVTLFDVGALEAKMRGATSTSNSAPPGASA